MRRRQESTVIRTCLIFLCREILLGSGLRGSEEAVRALLWQMTQGSYIMVWYLRTYCLYVPMLQDKVRIRLSS